MDRREVVSQESLSVLRFAGHGSTRNHACVYCRRSHMACDLERPCTRCIKRNIGHLCHDEPRDDDSKNRKTIQTAQTPQTNTMSIVNSNLGSCHYTISRDHTGAAEDQKSKILADFGRKHIKAWTNLSLANMNNVTTDPDSSAGGLESLSGPDTQTLQGRSSNYVITYQPNSKDEGRISFRDYAAALTQSESFPPLTPLRAASISGSSLLPSRTTRTAEMREIEQKAWENHLRAVNEGSKKIKK
ncbi:regulator of drug sensitivity 2 [Fusarium mundagurra]|uniref:Regulator of drug sensitivity 2 n=1 Tax=Fusarium mundagurra TaxID=1567541 RepID=A0A8H6D2G9_9HYPO|nr:regulator of drug sensitivity 2 [Fusarium mundagurra]